MGKGINRALAWKIFEALKENGADVGSASVNIIEQVIDNNDDLRRTNNLLPLLEECFENGNAGATQLYAWFSGEVQIIEQSIEIARKPRWSIKRLK